MNQLTINATATMSSIELVEVINGHREEGKAELRHDHFMVKLEKHPGIDSPKFLGQYKDSTGRTLKCYHLPKRECELMVMSESLTVQTKVYDRMTALEQQILKDGRPKPIDSSTEAFKLVPMVVRAARALGLDKNAAAISANQVVAKLTGTNVLQLLGHTHIEAEDQENQYFTPTELGKRIGTSARGINLLLAEAGMQLKRGEVWEVTDAGREFARLYDTGKKHGTGVPITQIKWAPSVLPLLGSEKEAA